VLNVKAIHAENEDRKRNYDCPVVSESRLDGLRVRFATRVEEWHAKHGLVIVRFVSLLWFVVRKRTEIKVAGKKIIVRIAMAFISELSCLAAVAICWAVWL
jgi:hypothetical protein